VLPAQSTPMMADGRLQILHGQTELDRFDGQLFDFPS
jgi:hypothetical protein